MDIPTPRGAFPKGPRDEPAAVRRERYEAWMMSAPPADKVDYEYYSIKFYRGRTVSVKVRPGSAEMKDVPAKPSRALCVKSRCWQCVSGGDDPNAQTRIAECKSTGCGLWHIRPYQGAEAVAVESSSLNPKAAIRKYCGQCVGGPNFVRPWNEVAECRAVTCGIWPVRPTKLAAVQTDELATSSTAPATPLTGL